MMKIAGRLIIPPSSGPRRQSRAASPAPTLSINPRRITRPAHRDRAHHQRIFEDQAPADDPGEQLAEHDIGIGIGAARGRDHGRHLGIGQRRGGADDAGDGEGEDHRRPGLGRADAGQGEDPGADDRPDPQGDQMRPAQGRLQPVLGRHVLGGDDRLPRVPARHGSPSPVAAPSWSGFAAAASVADLAQSRPWGPFGGFSAPGRNFVL